MEKKSNFKFSIIFILLFVFLFTSFEIFYSQQNCFSSKENIIHNDAVNNISLKSVETNDDLKNNVYYIKTFSNQTKALDVEWANYENYSNLISWNFTGLENQKFVFEESSNNTFRIRAFNTEDMYICAFSNESYEYAEFKLIKESEYTLYNLNSDKFKLEYNSSRGSYAIKTGISNYTKYLVIDNYQEAESFNHLVEKSFNYSYYNDYFWVLEKTNNLKENSIQNFSLNKNTLKTYFINVRFGLNYILKGFYDLNSLIQFKLYKYNNGENDYLTSSVGYNEINFKREVTLKFNFEAFEIYVLEVYCFDFETDIELKFYPEKTMSVDTIYDPLQNNIDRFVSIKGNYSLIAKAGYYPLIRRNRSASVVLENSVNGYKNINQNIYVFRGHGNPGGACYIEGYGNNSDWIDVYNLPSLDNVEIALWLCCESAAKRQDSSQTSLIRETAFKGARYSLGYKNEIRTSAANAFLRIFVENLYDLDINNFKGFIDNLIDNLKSEIWYYPFGEIYDPVIYENTGNGISLYYGVDELSSTKTNINDTVENEINNSFTINNKTFYTDKIEVKDKFIKKVYYESSFVNVIGSERFFTNIIFTENNYRKFLHYIQNNLKNKNLVLDNKNDYFMLSYYNNNFVLIKVIDNITDYLFLDYFNNKFVDEMIVSKMMKIVEEI